MPNKTPERWNAPKSANHKQGHTTTGYRLSQTGSTSRGNNLGECDSADTTLKRLFGESWAWDYDVVRTKLSMEDAVLTNDIDIRLALADRLQARHSDDEHVVIRHELGVDSGKRRIDVAVLNGHLAGWEIKSDKDTLSRLPEQAAAFSKVMDYMTIVTTKKYLDRCVEMLPPFWGAQEAISGPDGIRIVNRRAPKINRETDSFSLAQLLWREEAMDELKLRGNARGLSSSSRYYVWLRIAESIPKKELRTVVLARLKQRQAWTGGQLPTQYDGSVLG